LISSQDLGRLGRGRRGILSVVFSNLLPGLTRDGWLLFLARSLRLFAYGALSVVLVFYLTGLGFDESQTGLLLTMTLLGDTAVSLWITTRADRMGRRRMLIAGAALMCGAGAVFAVAHTFGWLLITATVGVISPSGNEVGPFLSIEQAALSQIVPARDRTRVFAWYTLAGALATAAGALAAGFAAGALGNRAVIMAYAGFGALLAMLFSRVSASAEIGAVPAAKGEPPRKVPAVVYRLAGLFALDAFGGGFVVQSFAAYWFYLRFGVAPATLGGIFFGANVFAGISALLASRLAARFGLVRTMVFTHLPSNVLLILVPLMPNLRLAIIVLLLRFSISQMDVPTRQSYTMAIVRPEERSAAAGITGVARTTGAAIAPAVAGFLFKQPALINVPFFIAGGLKIAYDLLLYRAFVSLHPPEEQG
jgi:MFS family permease